MKHLAIIIVMLLLSNTVIAQDFQGKATYKSHRKMDIQLDSTQMETEMHKRMIEMMKKQFEKTYILSFNKVESLYKEDVQLEAPQPAGMVMVMIGTGESGELYKNIKEDRYTDQNEMFGKVFLIEDKLRKIDWKLGSETKNIGEYTCYKATFTRTQEVQRMEVSVNGDNEFDEDAEPEIEEITVTAWYTTQIPVSNGPENYHGLPGLILEVNDGTQTLICSKIVLNPKDKVSITEPTKGKKITQEKYNEIMEKKMQEMRDRYQHNSGREGHTMEIRIGG
ncbi:GLPGLI family protein [Flavobacteriaceae bacterium AH-315-B10]|nr:GLPGLI family protein [Flavobacteriaceae bacterium AH-315-B10]